MRRHNRSPLNYQSEKFQRGYKVPKKFDISPKVILTGLKTVYIYLLLMLDLVLFTGSGNLDIFEGHALIAPELAIVSFLLLLVCVLIMSAFSFSDFWQNITCSAVTYWFIVVLFNQFSEFDQGNFIGRYLKDNFGPNVPQIFFAHSHIVLALVLAAAVFWFLAKAQAKSVAVYVVLFFFALVGILYHDYTDSQNQHDFIEIYESDENNANESKQKFIYIMLPNLASYKYFSTFDPMESQNVDKIIAGFLAKNNFKVYPNAYHSGGDTFLNMVSAVNPFDQNEINDHIMDTMLLYKYWRFFNLDDDYILLKDNQMFDTFKKADYKISAYKSRGVDICRKKYGFNVDRCIEKLNRPVNLYSMNLPVFDRAKLLFIEWIASMDMFSNLSVVYKTLKLFTQPEDLPMIGINYNNLYVVNSIKTFDVLTNDILTDKGRQAYFVFADIPSDMFVYDQFCNIKPQSEWISLNNLPWVNVDNKHLKRIAYVEQTKCLYGKLQELLDNLEKNQMLQNTVLVINGMSSTNNFQSDLIEDFSEDLLNNRLVMMAIKSPDNKTFSIQSQICPPKSILSHYLYKTPVCNGLEDSDIHVRLRFKLESLLASLDVTPEEAENDVPLFEKWYNFWKQYNKKDNTIDIINKDVKKKNIEKVDTSLPELQNETLQTRPKEND